MYPLRPLDAYALSRRAWLTLATLGAGMATPAHAQPRHPLPWPAEGLRFPRDHGAHPHSRIEWWYLTGWLRDGTGADYGFQITFFRSRVEAAQKLQSAFAARQLLFAHAALSEVRTATLHHAQRIARAGFGVAEAAVGDARLNLRGWTLQREDGEAASVGEVWRIAAAAGDFGLALRALATQPLLLQGDAGWSRKGSAPQNASCYYSLPQLQTHGELTLAGRRLGVEGRAWLDHEWSDALLPAGAVGWDWIGMNLHDGSALTAFRLRDASGNTLWAGGSWRRVGTTDAQIFAPNAVAFIPGRSWRSPRSGAHYPVQWTVQTPVGRFTVSAVFDAQELDGRGSTGSIYWEGLSSLRDANGTLLGHGYLEMTGYATPLRL